LSLIVVTIALPAGLLVVPLDQVTELDRCVSDG